MDYQVGGSLPPQSPTYIRRQADDDLFEVLLAGTFCYVFNARQMGKSSLRVQAMARLRNAGIRCGAIDLTAIGTQQVSAQQWYAAIAAILTQQFHLNISLPQLRQWWRDRPDLPPAARLRDFIDTVLLVKIRDPIAIFIDEIDAILSLNFATDDFFALIRSCYNYRADSPDYRRLTFALFGVTTPGELIADKNRTPFNIGRSIALHGFRQNEAAPLAQGLGTITSQPDTVFERILYWTKGQPFLTQKLCNLVLYHEGTGNDIAPEALVDDRVRQCILNNWETQDEPEHLKTIRDRLLYDERRVGKLLALYRQIWQAEDRQEFVEADESPTQAELLLSGIVEKRNGHLRVKNPIYRQVFDLAWIDRQLDHLRPYAAQLRSWVESECRDNSRLLRGEALREALDWTQRKSLGDLDYRYLTASQELEQQDIQRQLELQRLEETEARLAVQQQSVRRQRQFVAVLSIALLGAIGLGSTTFVAYRQVAISEVRAIVAASQGSFASNQRLDALVQALQARHNLKRLRFLSTETRQQLDRHTRQTLEQAIQGSHEFNRMRGHPGGALGVDFSPDRRFIASSGADTTVKLWRRDGTLLQTFPHEATVYSVRFEFI